MHLRWLWSLGIWFLLTTSIVATVGFAATDGDADGEQFETVASLPGDRAVYKSALVVVEGDEGQWFDLNARYAFQRLPDRVVIADGAELVVASSFVHEWVAEPFEFYLMNFLNLQMPTCLNDLLGVDFNPFDPEMEDFDTTQFEQMSEDEWLQFGMQMDACGAEFEAWGEELENNLELMETLSRWEERQHQVDGGAWHVSHVDSNANVVATSWRMPDALSVAGLVEGLPFEAVWTLPESSEAPCGFTHQMQNQSADIWADVVVHGACPPSMDFGFAKTSPLVGATTLKLAGEDQVGDWATTVFAHPDNPDLLRLWFTPDIAYPVRILSEIDVLPPEWIPYSNNGDPPRFYIMQELIETDQGEAQGAVPMPVLHPVSGIRTPWGPSDAGAGHDWPLSIAYWQAKSAPNSALDSWLRDHPMAALDTARFDDAPHWRFTLVDGDAGLRVDATLVAGAVNVTAMPFTANNRPDDSEQPSNMPSIASLARRHTALTGDGVSAWEFNALCSQSCQSVHLRTVVGTRPEWGDDATMLTVFDGEGNPRGQAQHPSPYPDPEFADGAWNPSAAGTGWSWNVASAGIWSWPEPKTAAGVAAATGLISLLYLLWPAVKGIGATPLFSRIKGEDLLEHPVRSNMFTVIEQNPGIHFQEIVRRLEKGRGTTEHHIRKLVSAGLLVEKADRGFTCYFPKGQVDRRLMSAAPVLKTAGARQVLQAVHASPGGVSADIASKLGMAPSTVNYHLKKLVAAELVDTTRQGRFLALHATALGNQAIGTFMT